MTESQIISWAFPPLVIPSLYPRFKPPYPHLHFDIVFAEVAARHIDDYEFNLYHSFSVIFVGGPVRPQYIIKGTVLC